MSKNIRGSNSSEFLLGTDAADKIFARRGNDTIFGGTGDDTIVGGPGDDTAVLEGSVFGYDLERSNGSTVTTSGPDGNDTFRQVEYLQFDDFTLNLVHGNDPVAFVREDTSVVTIHDYSLTVDLYDFDGDAITIDSISAQIGQVTYTLGEPVETVSFGTGLGVTIDYNAIADVFGGLQIGYSMVDTITVEASDSTGRSVTVSYDLLVTATENGFEATQQTEDTADDFFFSAGSGVVVIDDKIIGDDDILTFDVASTDIGSPGGVATMYYGPDPDSDVIFALYDSDQLTVLGGQLGTIEMIVFDDGVAFDFDQDNSDGMYNFNTFLGMNGYFWE